MDQNFEDEQKFSEGGRLKCYTCSILTSFYSKIWSNSSVKIMFNEYSTCYVSKKRFWAFFPSETDFLLDIHNHSRHTFGQYSKEGKRC